MDIREFRIADREAVIALWRECGLAVAHNDPAKDIDRKLKVDPDLFLVGCSDGQIIASVMGGYEGHRGWINYLAVKPAYRQRGYGREIMRAVESRINDRGCPKINLQVRTGNAQSIAFYTALGYSDDRVIGLGKRLERDD